MKWRRGSEWRKWDLHVHSPASAGFKGDWNQFVIQVGNADCDVIGINDYFSVAGYKEIRRRMGDSLTVSEGNKPYREALERLQGKTLLPVVECRMNNIVLGKKLGSGPRINFHLIFSPDVDTDDIETFLRSIKVKDQSIGGRYNDPVFLRDKTSVNFAEICRSLREDRTFADRFLIWIPYDEYGGIDEINPETDKLFKEGLVQKADILGSSRKAQAEFFLWRDRKYSDDQYREWFGKRKPCIKGSDSHDVNDELGKLKDHQSRPTDKYCWIKADPTFDGLRQITNEPADRVYIGRLPPKMQEVSGSPTRFVSCVRVRPVAGAKPQDTWFDCEIPLNSDMVAIIGKKGSGKSALTDAIGLIGNAHCDTKYFSFLTKERFCERNGRIAKDFEVEATWEDGSTELVSLNAKPDPNAVELVKYIPQAYLEKVCTETEPGQQSEFQHELRKVIFSHISEADRLGRESLDELLDYKTAELVDQLTTHRQSISRMNDEIVRLEAKASSESRAQLEAKLKQKQRELDAHMAAAPARVEKPADRDAEQVELHRRLTAEIEEERQTSAAVEKEIGENRSRLTVLTGHIALADKLLSRIANVEAEFARIKEECESDFQKLSLNFGEALSLKVDTTMLSGRREELVNDKNAVDEVLSPERDGSLLLQKADSVARMKALQEQLDAPNKRYQEYQAAQLTWDQEKQRLEGDPEQPDTLSYYRTEVARLTEELPKQLAELQRQRRSCAEKVHETITSIKEVYEGLFAPVQRLIEGSVLIKEGFKLAFNSTILERTFQRDFFTHYVNQGVAGSFCGKEKGAQLLEEIRANHDFERGEDAVAFAEEVARHLQHDVRGGKNVRTSVPVQLRKHVTLKELYDYIWSFEYLDPEYSLKLDDRDLSHLSPGERGTLLLVFYLLVDKSTRPIVVDQPEENLDSETVYRLLIPVIKEVKKRRQIIMVTHSPNIAVVCDAEQIVHANIDREAGNRVTYETGSIESPQINRYLVDVLEGTRPAFDNRGSKYFGD